jgi:hypothetical protein
MFAGQVTTGVWTSTTVTANEQDVVCPLDVTEMVFVVVPMGKFAPLARPAVRVVVEPGQLSVPTGMV